MARAEFSKKTMRQALERSQMRCEAIGRWYGLDEGQRCSAPLGYGVEFDHIVADNLSHDNSLENCAAVCKVCHSRKTAKVDTPTAAKVKRVADKAKGVKKASSWPQKPKGMKYDWGRGRYVKSD